MRVLYTMAQRSRPIRLPQGHRLRCLLSLRILETIQSASTEPSSMSVTAA